MLREKSCGAVVYSTDGASVKFLVLKHRKGGHWSFPKGHVEGEETPEETALREVKEETGLDISLRPNYCKSISYSPRPRVDKEVIYFLGYSPTMKTTMQEEEISEIIWVDYENIKQYLNYNNDHMLIDHAVEYLKEDGVL